jgi:DNA polymerase
MILDFETYYGDDYTLSNLSTSAYVMDPRFEVIGVGIRFGDRRAWLEEYQWRAFARSVDWSQIMMLCHHAHFDGLIGSYHYGVRPGYWLDTLSMARALHGITVGGSLGKVSAHYEVGVKGTEVVQAKGKRRADFTQEEWLAYGGYCLNDCDLTLGILQKMLPTFPRPELDLIDTTVRMFTDPVLVLDQEKMAQYYADEIKRKETLLLECGADKKVLGSGDKFADLLRQFNVEPPTKLSPKQMNEDGSPKRVYAFAKTDPGMQELLEHEEDDVRLLAEARISIKSTLNESRSARILSLGSNGRPMPVYLNYSGAFQTKRWSGGDKVNWQNFEKTNKKNLKKGIIRKSIRAPKGYKVVKADASQVEARFNAWESGQDDLVALFASGVDVYSSFATDAYGRKIDRKNVAEDELPGQVAKICILGLGYRMGYLKLAGELLMGRGGAEKVQFKREDMERLNIDPAPFLSNPRIVREIKEMPSRLPEADRMIHCTVTNYFVQTYRTRMNKIAGNWKYWDEVIKWMASGQYVGAKVGNRGLLTIVEDGLLMPHGLILRYPHLEHSKENGFSFLADKGQRKKIHGGFMVENYTQALTRVIVADAMRALTWGRQRAGLEPYKIAQMEHDALTCVVEEARAGECLTDLMRAISTPPAWAQGLPLAAEGGIGDTMGDAK